MKITMVPRLNIAYALLPYKRNQDVIRVHSFDDDHYVVCVVDGWNHPKELSGDEPGRQVAIIVAQEFPETYVVDSGRDEKERADHAVFSLNASLEKRHPRYASCVASFLIHDGKKGDVIVSVGDVETYLWESGQWYKPKGIKDHWIDPKTYQTNVSRMFGRGELNKYPEVTSEPDVVTIPSRTPILIATDGIKDVLSLSDVNALAVNSTEVSPKEIVETILQEVIHRGTQRDDISVLVRL